MEHHDFYLSVACQDLLLIGKHGMNNTLYPMAEVLLGILSKCLGRVCRTPLEARQMHQNCSGALQQRLSPRSAKPQAAAPARHQAAPLDSPVRQEPHLTLSSWLKIRDKCACVYLKSFKISASLYRPCRELATPEPALFTAS